MKNTAKKISVGSWITLAHPSIAEIFCSAGFEWIVVDLEHSSITIREAEDLIRVINLCGSKCYVRLTSHNTDQMKRVLDSGADGIIMPMVKTAFDVQKLIENCLYYPYGSRSVGLARAQEYGNDLDSYIKNHKKKIKLFVQIEHVDAIKNLDEIFSFKELYGYIIGPYDLSASMGIPGKFKDKRFKKNINIINQIAEKYKINKGIHLVEPDPKVLIELKKQNYDFVAYSLDIRMLDTSARQALKLV